MPTTKSFLTDRKIASLREGRHADGHNLYIHVRGGARTWVMRYKFAEKRREMQLGRYPSLSLADARAQALACRRELDMGRDPLVERAARERVIELEQRRASQTLEVLCREYYASNKERWRNAKHAAQWISSLENHVFPTFGKRPIASITEAELQKLLKAINVDRHETAKRIRQRLEAVWAEAIISGLTKTNPPTVLIRALKGPALKRHFESLDYDLVPAFVRQLRDSDAGLSVRAGFEFLILACARTIEIRNAIWADIDLQKKIWTIPAERMKAAEPHEVPLTDRMLEILEAMKPLSGGKNIIFPGYRLNQLSDGAFLAVLRRMKRNQETTVHGFRGSFSTWARETNREFRTDVIEAALAHSEKNAVAAAYNHADYWTQRRKLAQNWTDFVIAKSPVPDVVVGAAYLEAA